MEPRLRVSGTHPPAAHRTRGPQLEGLLVPVPFPVPAELAVAVVPMQQSEAPTAAKEPPQPPRERHPGVAEPAGLGRQGGDAEAPGGGGDGVRARAGGAGSGERCPARRSRVRCGVPRGVGRVRPRWPRSRLREGRVRRASGAGARAARDALPAAPGLARGGRGRSWGPASGPLPRPPRLSFLSSLRSGAGSTCRHRLLRPISAPGAGLGRQSPAGSGEGCIMCSWPGDSGEGRGREEGRGAAGHAPSR